MTLLEKLNLEPDGRIEWIAIRKIALALSSDPISHVINRQEILGWAYHQPRNLTNAEFLAACEEWLKKN